MVLGLLFSMNSSFAASVSDYLYKGMSKKQLRQFTMPMGLSQPLFKTEEFLIYGVSRKQDCLYRNPYGV